MICKKCAQQIDDRSIFCNFCGVKQAAEQKKTTRKPKSHGNGQGSVYRRGDKWAAEVTLGYYIKDGKKKRKIRRKCGFDKKKDAVAYLETLRNTQRTRGITLEALYSLFEQAVLPKLSRSKNDNYRTAWKKIQPSAALLDITKLSVRDLQSIVDEYGNSYYTKRSIKDLLSHLYKLAIKDDYLYKNKAHFIDLPQLESTERTIFTDSEIEAFWMNRDQYIVQHILIMLYTGMRPAELLQIKLENIHPEDHYMTGGVKTKKSKDRKIIIPDKLAEPLRSLAEAAKGDKLTNYSKYKFYAEWKAYKASQGLRVELSPYCCRHTYITRLTALKVSPAMLQELAGHEDYETTLEYTHLSIADRLAEVNRL